MATPIGSIRRGRPSCAAGFGLFHPTTAIQGIRDQLATNEFRYTIRRTPGPFAHAFSQGTGMPGADDFGTQGVWPDVQSPDIYQYNFTIERELPWEMGLRASYLGSTMRKLLVNREYNSVRASTVDFYNYDSESNARRPFPMYGAWMNMIENTGSGQFHAAQFELTKRFRRGFAFDVAYMYAHSDSNAPDSGNSSLGVLQYDPYNLEADRGPDPVRGEAPAARERDARSADWEGAPAGLGHARVGRRALRRLDRVGHLPGEERRQPDAVLHVELVVHAVQHRLQSGRDGRLGRRQLRPNQSGDPMANVPAGMFFNPAVYSMPDPESSRGIRNGTASWGPVTGS